MTKKILALLLAVLFVVAAFAACSKPQTGGNETAEGTQGSEETSLYPDSLPASLKFDGADIRIAHPDNVEISAEDIFVEDPGGDVIKQAVYTAQMVVEDRLGVRYNFCIIPESRTTYSDTIVNSYASNEDAYDLVAEAAGYACISASKSAYADLKATKYLDFTKPYWNQNYVENFSVGENNEHLYWASGDIAVSYLKRLTCMFCNTVVAADFGIDVSELEQLIIDGKWTAETMKEYAMKVNLIADPTNVNKEIDTVGLVVPVRDHATMMAAGLGVYMLDKEGNCTFGNSHAVDAVQWMVHLFNDNAQCTGTFSLYSSETLALDRGMILQDRALFTTAEFQDAVDVYSEKVGDLIPLPLPKWSEDDDYSTFSRMLHVTYSIMRSCTDTDLASAVMECMASVGSVTLTPAYFQEALKIKYSDATPESKAIFDIIRRSAVVDWGYYTQFAIQTSAAQQLFIYTYILNNDYGWASGVKARQKAWERGMSQFLDALNSLELER